MEGVSAIAIGKSSHFLYTDYFNRFNGIKVFRKETSHDKQNGIVFNEINLCAIWVVVWWLGGYWRNPFSEIRRMEYAPWKKHNWPSPKATEKRLSTMRWTWRICYIRCGANRIRWMAFLVLGLMIITILFENCDSSFPLSNVSMLMANPTYSKTKKNNGPSTQPYQISRFACDVWVHFVIAQWKCDL